MKFLIILSVLVWSASAFANSGWGEADCLNYGGKVKTLSVGWPRPQVLKFCFLNNMATMDLKTLDFSKFNTYGGPEANRAYRRTLQYDISACERNAGFNTDAVDEQGFRLRVCSFFDNSYIGLTTLIDGVASPWNRIFNNILGIF